MIVFYAPGGGMGHLTRIDAFLHTRSMTRENILVVTATPEARSIFPSKSIHLIPRNAGRSATHLRRYLQEQLPWPDITTLFVDTFPGGIMGEWMDFPTTHCEFEYIGRNVKWEDYAPLLTGKPLHYRKAWLCEEINPKHRLFLEQTCTAIESLPLVYPVPDLPESLKLALPKSPRWLIVHSGPESEVMALLEHARDLAQMEGVSPHFCIVTHSELDSLPIDCQRIRHYPARSFYPYFDRIFTGGGFNCFHELRGVHGHVALPFVRRFDDQFARCAGIT